MHKILIIILPKRWCLQIISFILAQDPMSTDACRPNPCGPNSQCREINNQATCSCLPNYFGEPPNCRPECVLSSDCTSDKACVNQKCVNPCPGPCGKMAECRVFNHNSICSCGSGFTGDPFTRCYLKPSKFHNKMSLVGHNLRKYVSNIFLSFSTATSFRWNKRPMYTISMWRFCKLSQFWWSAFMFLFSGLYW